MAQARPPVRPTEVERRQRWGPTEGATPMWVVDVVTKDKGRLLATFRSLNYFNALRMKNWWTDNGVPQTASAVPEAIEVVLDRWPPIPTDLADEVA